jgi:hypothetical protein
MRRRLILRCGLLRLLPLSRKMLYQIEIEDRRFAFSDDCRGMRSCGGNIIALATAERNFIVPWSVRVTSSSGSKAMFQPYA